jgi:4-hydroxy-3-methylbut-2-enyl diphosphate reductase
LITAHGISDAERRRLHSADKILIDTTCPLVRRVHDAVLKLQGEGRHVLVLGKQGHVEVQGLIEDLASYDVVSTADDVRCYDEPLLGVVCQTTMPPDLADEICSHIQLYNPLADIRMVDTICEPTKVRQRAMLDLVTRVEAVVVVGGRNSNNTKQLVRICCEHLTPVLHIERASELEPTWFSDVSVVGLTAGTSTLDSTIDEVEHTLMDMDCRFGAVAE